MKKRYFINAFVFVMLISMITCVSAFAQDQNVSEKSAVELPILFQEHVNTCRASVATGGDLETSTIKKIEDVLAECDNYFDLEFAVASLQKAEQAAGNDIYLLAPLYRVVLEKARFAATSGRDGLDNLIKKLATKLQKAVAAAELAQTSLDLPEGMSLVFIGLEDNSKERRLDNLKRIITNHNMNQRLFYDAGKVYGSKNPVYNHVIATSNDNAAAMAKYYGGQVLTRPFKMQLTLYSGGFFSPMETYIQVKVPRGLDADASLDWLLNEVMNNGWTYIYENAYEEFKKHAKLDDGKDRIKNGKIKFKISVEKTDGSSTVLEEEKEYSDLYFEVK